MSLTVISKSSINTSQARAAIELAPEDARAYCEYRKVADKPRCVDEVIAKIGKRLRKNISADCVMGSWIDMFGRAYSMRGGNISSSRDQRQFIINDEATGEELDGSFKSGSSVQEGIFRMLCPELADYVIESMKPGPVDKNDPPKKTLSYASRAGQEVTIISEKGLDTEKSIIHFVHTRKNAQEFCENYLQDSSKACVNKHAGDVSPLRYVTGNCIKRTWKDMYGGRYIYLGKNKRTARVISNDYIIKRIKTKETLDGSSASGYGIQLGIFQALCPKTFEKEERKHTKKSKDWDLVHKLEIVDSGDAEKIVKEEPVIQRDGKVDLSSQILPSDEQNEGAAKKSPTGRRPLESAYSLGDDQELTSMSEDVAAPAAMPKPRPKPIEVLLMSAADMEIKRPSAPPPDSTVKSSPVAGGSQGIVVSPESMTEAPGIDSNAGSKIRLVEEVENGEAKNVPTIRNIAPSASGDDLFWWPHEPVFESEAPEKGGQSVERLADEVKKTSPRDTSLASDITIRQPSITSLEDRIASLEQKVEAATTPNRSDRMICKMALSRDGSQWEGEPEFRGMVDEALERGLTINKCQDELGLSNPSGLQKVPEIQQAETDKLNAELKNRSGKKRKFPLETAYDFDKTDGTLAIPLSPSSAESEEDPLKGGQPNSNEDKQEFSLGCLSYAGQAYACVPVIMKVGIGTRKAVITVKPTLYDAIEACAEVNSSDTPKEENIRCGQENFAEQKRLKSSVSADCKNRTWTDLYGNSFRLLGKSKKTDDFSERYVVIESSTRERVFATPYYTVTSVFSDLCPSIAPKDW